ncbi:MAG: hypothetical protein H7144_17185 [Burkholderiales bacterium]|nr:hypothetical protein [Phycisphaerae bacterium]
MAIPYKDSLLVPYAQNWGTRLTAAPGSWQLLAADATAINNAVTPYVSAYNTLVQARESGIRSSELAANKDAARDAMLTVLRTYYGRIQDNPAVTPGNKELLGITVRKSASPIPVPTEVPTIDIKKVVGYTVYLHVHGEDESRKGLPPGVQGIMIYSFVGSTPSPDVNAWTSQGIISRSNLEIEFPSSTAPGAQVWFRCCFYNPRGQCGPASSAVFTHLQFATGSLLQAA